MTSTLLASCDATPSGVEDGGDDAGAAVRDGSGPDGSRDASRTADARVICRSDADCDDGAFCNGPETCAPSGADADVHGCVTGASPCTAPMVCSESADACSTSCGDGDHDGHTESSCGGDDCDDADAAAHPGASEVCNGHDDDCDTRTDEGVSTTFYADADADGYGDDATSHAACAAGPGEVASAGDCDDTDPAIHPSATETCDDRDQDCDGRTDEGVATLSWPDSDGDGFGALGTPTSGCTVPAGSAPRTGDCDDTAAAIHPTATELCNGVDDDCNGLLDGPSEDLDGDGAASQLCGGFDCDDHDATSTVGVAETCNGIDDDCDARTDEGTLVTSYRDADGDGFGVASAPTTACVVPAGYATMSGDCDDGNPAVSPAALEACNMRDDDCDTRTDEGVSFSFYTDADHDGHGTGAVMNACMLPTGVATVGDDCSDTNASVYPGAPDLCDGLDDDCAPGGASDDLDNDGYLITGATCMGGPYAALPRTDCDDARAFVHPGATEVCNGVDDDCSGSIDDGPAPSANCALQAHMHQSGTCVSPYCQLTCNAGWGDCSSGVAGCETLTTSWSTSCGSCGTSCAAGQVCASSACVSRYVGQTAITGGTVRFIGMAFDASGNVYVTGSFSGATDFGGGALTSAGMDDIFVASYTSAGVFRWASRYGSASSDFGQGIAVDGSANVYVSGTVIAGTSVGGAALPAGGFLASYTSTGTHRWSRSDGYFASGVTVDSAGNVTVVGQFPPTGQSGSDFGGGTVTQAGNGDLFVASYTSAGAYRWARTYGSIQQEGNVAGIGSDAAGNIYFGHRGGSGRVNYGDGVAVSGSVLVSLTSAGAFRWRSSDGAESPIAVDASGNVYFYAYDGTHPRSSDIPFGLSLWSVSSTGAYRWNAPFVAANPNALTTDAAGNVYFAATATGNVSPFVHYGAFGTVPNFSPFIVSFDTAGNPRWSLVGPGAGALGVRGSVLYIGGSGSFGGAALSAGIVRFTP